jgi:hypothetical protein
MTNKFMVSGIFGVASSSDKTQLLIGGVSG